MVIVSVVAGRRIIYPIDRIITSPIVQRERPGIDRMSLRTDMPARQLSSYSGDRGVVVDRM